MAEFDPIDCGCSLGQLHVRAAQPEDAATLLAVFRRAADESDGLTRGSDEIASTVDEYSAFLAKCAASPTDLFIVAELAGRQIGFARLTGSTLKRFRHEAMLGIAVLREAWGHGVGAALVRGLLGWADANAVVRVALEVAATNERAIRLYQSHGFVVEGRLRARRKHGAQFVDNLVMARVQLDTTGQ